MHPTHKMTTSQLQDKMFECEDNVFNQIKLLNDKIDAHAISMSESKIEQTKISIDIKLLSKQSDLFSADLLLHTKEEMEKYNDIMAAIVNLTDELRMTELKTKAHSGYIQSKEANEVLEDRVAEKMLEEHQRQDKLDAPIKARKQKAIMTAIGVVTATLTGGIMAIGYMVLETYILMNGSN